MPRNSPTGFICAFFAVVRLRADLAHLVDGRARAGGRLRDLRGVRLARPGRVLIPAAEVARIDRANRSARSEALRMQARMSAACAPGGTRPASGRPGRRTMPAIRPVTRHGAGGLASKRIIVGYGFWIFLLSDIIMFSAFFATYAVLVGNTAGGPSGRELFDLRNVAIETACLLLSSFTCGLASIGARQRARSGSMARWRRPSCSEPLSGLEPRVRGLVARGAGPTRSAFLSAFFTLVGCHGLHVTAGLLWLLTMMAQVFAKGTGRHSAAHPVLQPVLARPRHHLGGHVHRGVSDGSRAMSHSEHELDAGSGTRTPRRAMSARSTVRGTRLAGSFWAVAAT
jgi:cytochrome o ubiquinol oxidase subunit III